MSSALLAPAPEPIAEIATTRSWPRLGIAWVLPVWCLLLFGLGITSSDLYRTEGLRALLAEEFLRSGNWILPTLYEEPLLTKPPGIYAAIALVSWPIGHVTTFTARLPSVLAAIATVLLFYGTFARCLGRRAGLIAALLLPASILWLERVPSAEIDLLQLAWVAAALLAALRAVEAAEEAPDQHWQIWGWWQAALLAVAGGVLTKWTAPAFFYLTLVPFLAWRRRLLLLLAWPHLLAAVFGAALCFAWASAAIDQVGWSTFVDTVGREALQRLSPAHHPRAYPWRELLQFPLEFLIAALPCSFFALFALRPSFGRLWNERGQRLWQLLHSWTWINLLFWAIIPGHRPRHVMPLQPGLAGLAALVWIAWLTGRCHWPIRRFSATFALSLLLTCWLTVKIVHATVIVPGRDVHRHTRATGELLAERVPVAEKLYLGALKDEGVLFYFGRPARRLDDLTQVPRGSYLLLTESEWQSWPTAQPLTLLESLRDEQGASIRLVQLKAR